MPIGTTAGFFSFLSIHLLVKAFFVLILVFYGVFAIILYRQIISISGKLPTTLAPFLKFMGLVHVGVALALLSIVIGLF